MASPHDTPAPVTIMVAEFVSTHYPILVEELARIPAKVVRVTDPLEVAPAVLENKTALILMDIEFADADNFQVVKKIRTTDDTQFIPIILLADISKNDALFFKGYEAGCVDFLFRPIKPAILRAKLRVHLELYHRQLELKEANVLIGKQNRLLQQQAWRDGLTGLYNHIHFQKLFAQHFYLAKRHEQPFTLLMMDIDFFKEVNDSYGHQVGDSVLKRFAHLVQSEIRQTDIWARYGGEEFVLALPDTSQEGGLFIGEKICRLIAATCFSHGEITLQVTVSIGLSVLSDGMENPAELIEQADHALYQAKAQGRNRVDYYVPGAKRTPGSAAAEGKVDLGWIRQRLRTTLEKTRAGALASFEAMVHNQTKNHHSQRRRTELAGHLVNGIAERLQLPPHLIQSFHRSFKIHDLFRLFIADAALDKEGSLNHTERLSIQDQPLMLKELTELFDFFAEERAILRFHHEHYDGHGYPQGLDGYEIPMGARLFALVDAFLAMSNPHYARPPMSLEAIIAEIESQSAKQFDPFLVKIMLEVLEDKKSLLADHGLDDGEVLV
ncbi:MAG: diguanylate cyclase [Desulfurivibrionaceae bacterium]|nr:diguanylate cyclase [Desulfurivibrionaceae bacterium]